MLPNGTCAAIGMEPTPKPSPPVPMRGSTKERVSGSGEGAADVNAARIKKKCTRIEETGMCGQLKDEKVTGVSSWQDGIVLNGE